MEAKRTPLYQCHLNLGARMVPFAGFEMPVQYSGVLNETKAVRKDCGLFDVSHMGQLSIRGRNALTEVNKLITNDLEKLSLGQAQYNILCNPEGGVIDDLIVYRRSEEEIFICVNAANRQADVEWFRSHLGSTVDFRDLSDELSLIALQGPKSEDLLARFSDQNILRNLNYYWAAETEAFGLPCYLSRTGYTGEDGFELYIENRHATQVWEQLLEEGRPYGILPIGLGARDTLRMEMGYPLHGHELSATISPMCAGLSWVVKLNKRTPFTGQQALKAEKEAGPKSVLRGFVTDDRRIPRSGYAIADRNRKPVGTITSGTHSPHVDKPIALGFVSPSAAGETTFFIQIRESFIEARTVGLPFVPAKTKKAGKK